MAGVFLMAFFMVVLVGILVNYIVCIYGFLGNYSNTRGNGVNSLVSSKCKAPKGFIGLQGNGIIKFSAAFQTFYG